MNISRFFLYCNTYRELNVYLEQELQTLLNQCDYHAVVLVRNLQATFHKEYRVQNKNDDSLALNTIGFAQTHLDNTSHQHRCHSVFSHMPKVV